jgi:hypothetical protein
MAPQFHVAALMTVMGMVTACVEADNVGKLGPDTYYVTGNFTRGLADDARDRTISTAGEYCDRMGRRVLVQKSALGTTDGHGRAASK